MYDKVYFYMQFSYYMAPISILRTTMRTLSLGYRYNHNIKFSLHIPYVSSLVYGSILFWWCSVSFYIYTLHHFWMLICIQYYLWWRWCWTPVEFAIISHQRELCNIFSAVTDTTCYKVLNPHNTCYPYKTPHNITTSDVIHNMIHVKCPRRPLEKTTVAQWNECWLATPGSILQKQWNQAPDTLIHRMLVVISARYELRTICS